MVLVVVGKELKFAIGVTDYPVGYVIVSRRKSLVVTRMRTPSSRMDVHCFFASESTIQ